MSSPFASHTDSPASPVVILGADVVLAAQPATAVQLAHACRALGFATAIPVSWGDELVAAEAVRRIAVGQRPMVRCSCPLVVERLLAEGDELSESIVRLPPPAVAASRYLRALYAPVRLLVTYAGSCHGAEDVSIDACLTPAELFRAFLERGIVVGSQPKMYDSILPPDRRRYCSEPGGVPSGAYLRSCGVAMMSPAPPSFAVDVAHCLLSGARAVVEVAPAVGCACVYGSPDAEATAARLASAEPPRSPQPVVDSAIALDWSPPILRHVERPLPPAAKPMEHARERTPAPSPVARGAASSDRASIAPRRSPAGGVPVSRDVGGRRLPRAYVAHRRSSPGGTRRMESSEAEDAALERAGRRHPVSPPSALSIASRSVRLAIVMGGLVVLAAALGFSIGQAMH